MKVKHNVKLIKCDEGFFVTPLEYQLTLSNIGAFLFTQAQSTNLTHPEMLELLLTEFEISTVLALSEIDTFIKSMKENGLFEQ